MKMLHLSWLNVKLNLCDVSYRRHDLMKKLGLQIGFDYAQPDILINF